MARRLLFSGDMIIPPTVMKSMSALFALIIFAQPVPCLAGSARSVAIQPMVDGNADDASREISREIADVLKASTQYHVVDSDLAAEVASYQASVAAASPDAAVLISAAKDLYFNFKYDAANQSLERAIGLLEAEKVEPGSAELLLDAYLSKALIANSRGNANVARDALNKAMEIDPMLTIAADQYPPSMIALYEEVRGLRANDPRGSLSVRSEPKGAQVLVNGIVHGVTPFSIEGLPVGDYALTIKANRYAPFEKRISVAANNETRVKQKLKWLKDGNSGVGGAFDEASAAVREGVRLADALKVDRTVLIDADAAGKTGVNVTARMVDRAIQAGARPLKIEGVEPATKSRMLAELVKGIGDQIELDLTRDPASSISPAGEADAAVLAKRKKPLTRQPLFWGAIGTAAAGAIIGGILAAMSSGGASTGSVKVSFK